MHSWLIFSIVLTACATSTPAGGSGDIAAIAIDSWTHDGKDRAGDAGDAAVANCQIGAACAWKSCPNHPCCASGSWQFCSETTCNWYACQADSQSGCS